MLQGWVVIAVALGYIGLLFLVASYGDRIRRLGGEGRTRLLIYPLSLAIYCTSWTFFGSVGSASRTGYEFLTIYIGPVLMVGLFSPLLMRMVRLAKAQNITSIADFIAARYGKGQAVAATVALIAIIGTVPYIALQLKAVSSSLETIIAQVAPGNGRHAAGARRHRAVRGAGDGGLRGAVRHPPYRRHRAPGRPDAGDRGGIDRQAVRLPGGRHLRHLLDVRWARARCLPPRKADPDTAAIFTRSPPFDTFLATTLLSFVAIILLPRQFHVAVVENHSEGEIKRAAWLFPLYLRADQPVRGADRARRPLDLPVGRDRRRHVSCWRCRCMPAPTCSPSPPSSAACRRRPPW